MGGTDEPSNLIYLSKRDHVIAHWLLWKIHGINKLLFAYNMMRNGGSDKVAAAKLSGALARERLKGKPMSEQFGGKAHQLTFEDCSAGGKIGGKSRSAAKLAHLAAAKQSKYYILTSPAGCEMVIRNLAEFCREYGFNRTSLKNIVNGYAKATRDGWTIRLVEKDIALEIGLST